MNRSFLIWLCIAGLLLLAVIAYFWLSVPPDGLVEDTADTAPAAALAQPQVPDGVRMVRLADNPTPGAPVAKPGPQRIDKAARAKLLKAITEAIAVREQASAQAQPGAAEEPAVPNAPPKGSLDKEYLRERIGEIIPLVQECYEMELAQQPGLEGTVKVSFTIVGDEEVGGVISESHIAEQTLNEASPGLNECIRETMYAIQLKAPKGGGEVKVTYPFKFRSAE